MRYTIKNGARSVAVKAAIAAMATVLTAGTMTSTAPPASAGVYSIFIRNEADKPLWGEFHSQCGGVTGGSSRDASNPWPTGIGIDVTLLSCSPLSALYLWGRACWAGKWQNLERHVYDMGDFYIRSAPFTLNFKYPTAYGVMNKQLTTTDAC